MQSRGAGESTEGERDRARIQNQAADEKAAVCLRTRPRPPACVRKAAGQNGEVLPVALHSLNSTFRGIVDYIQIFPRSARIVRNGPPTSSTGKSPSIKARFFESFSHLPKAFVLVWRSSPGGTLVIALLTIVSAFLPLSIAWVGKLIVDAVVTARSAAPGFARNTEMAAATRWVLIELGLVAISALIERAGGLIRQLVGARLGMDISVLVLEKALKLDLRHFENPEIHDKLIRARREASSRPLSLVQQSLTVIRGSLTLAGYTGLLIAFSPWAVVGLLLAAVPAFISEAWFSGAAYRQRNRRSPEARKLNYLEYLLTSDDHVKEIKLFELGSLVLSRYKLLAEELQQEDRKLSIVRTIWTFVLSLISTAAFYSCYVVITIATIAGRLSLGDMTLYLMAFRQGQQLFQSILSALGGMYEDNLYITNLFEFLAIPTEGTRRPSINGALVPVQTEQGIRFEEVGFKYPDAKDWALRGINLFIPKGQSLAIVGENGAGKTTFIKLLTRLYEPTEGRVFLDGIDLREWNAADLRRRIGVIFQDFNQYQFIVRENVGFGSVDHLTDDVRITRAIDQGGARELLASFSSGLETQLLTPRRSTQSSNGFVS